MSPDDEAMLGLMASGKAVSDRRAAQGFPPGAFEDSGGDRGWSSANGGGGGGGGGGWAVPLIIGAIQLTVFVAKCAVISTVWLIRETLGAIFGGRRRKRR